MGNDQNCLCYWDGQNNLSVRRLVKVLYGVSVGPPKALAKTCWKGDVRVAGVGQLQLCLPPFFSLVVQQSQAECI
jgi:hypothetical protein